MRKNCLIIGAGGVANVVAHKCAQNNDILGDICIASRTLNKCDEIIESIHRKGNLKQAAGRLFAHQLDAMDTEVFIYNVCDHHACYAEVESQAISYTAGVPPVAAAILIAKGIWDVKTMVNVEELDPDPFIELLGTMGLPTKVKKNSESEIA